MRIIGRLILILFIGLPLLWITFHWIHEQLNTTQSKHENIEDYNRYTSYWLSTEDELVFEIPSNAIQIRIQATSIIADNNIDEEPAYLENSTSHSTVASHDFNVKIISASNQDDKVDEYKIPNDYFIDELIDIKPHRLEDDKTSKNLVANSHHLNVVGDNENEVVYERYFDTEPRELASETLSIIKDNAINDPITKLHISRVGKRPIAIRISILTQRSDDELPILWERMQKQKQQRLMSDHIQPLPLIEDREVLQALKYSWQPLGPNGIENKDYTSSTLYVKEDSAGKASDTFIAKKTDLIASKNERVTFAQTVNDGVSYLVCRTLNGKSIGNITIGYQFANNHNIKESIYQSMSSEFKLDLEQFDGMVQVSADNACFIELFDYWDKSREVEQLDLQSYEVEPGETWILDLPKHSSADSVIRVDTRVILEHELHNSTIQKPTSLLTWQIYNNNDEVETEGRLELSLSNDIYEQTKTMTFDVAERTKHFFIPSKNAKQLTITNGNARVLINAYTRPYRLPVIVKASQQLDLPTFYEPSKKWFSVYPRNQIVYETKGKKHLIRRYRPLANFEAQKTSVVEQWFSLESLQSNLPKYDLFVPEDFDASKLYNKNLTYWPVSSINSALLLESENISSVVSPVLIFLKDDKGTQEVTVEIKNAFRISRNISGLSGIIELPEVKSGKHRMTIENTHNARWFMNSTTPTSETPHRKRAVYRLNNQIEFKYTKELDDEWLTLLYFPSTKEPHELDVRLNLKPSIGVHSNHTISHYQYQLSEQLNQADVIRLNSSSAPLWRPIEIKIPVFGDAKQGDYVISVQSSLKGAGYVQASYIKDSVSEKASLSSEWRYDE